jgi:PIN domain nuclease of toxin-antitoxin system
MKLFLDTHALLWWLLEPSRLSRKARRSVASRRNDVWVSAATSWEVLTKHRIGKLPSIGGLAANLFREVQEEGFQPLSITFLHACLAGSFTHAHRDPFDRVLAAQTLLENLQLVSADPAFDQFGIERVW